MNALAAYGLAAHALIFGALVAMLPLGELRPRVALAGITLALLIGIAPGLHGLFGMPSVTLLQLAILQLANRTPSPLSLRPATGLLVFAAVYYPASHGLGPFDPYALGLQPWPIMVALTPIAVALWWRKMYVGMTILAVDLLAYGTGLFPNFWDVLIDPLLVLLSLAIVSRHLALRFIATRIR